MIKRMVVVSIIALVALSAFAGPAAARKYNEAPMLAELVRAGKLPPVEERLPENPLVVEPFEKIGKYGGILHALLWRQPSDGIPVMINHASLTYLDTKDMVTVTPGLVERWEFSNNYKTLTMYFRRGVKWSDGVPFTVDDVLFYYEDCLMNKEMTPAVPSFWKGSSAKKIDDYTLQFTFPTPKPHFFRPYGIRNNGLQEGFFFPKHYAKQFHVKYNPDAQKLAEKAGFDHWYQLLRAKATSGEHLQNNPEVPVLSPWRVVESTPEYIMWERNPYFWAVDTAGNQLPYIDKLMGVFALNADLRKAKVLAGEVDVADPGRDVDLSVFPELKSKEKELGLKVWTTPSIWGNMFALMPNQTHKDPKKRELFRNLKFRQAISLAIDRDEINEVLFMGLAIPQQVVPVPASGFYYPELAKYYAEYDPDRANRLLDEIGLNKRDAQGFRTWPDGKDLKLKLDLGENIAVWPDIAELVARQLRKVGLDVTTNLISYEALKENIARGEADIPCWAHAGGCAIDMFNGIHGLLRGWMYGNAWFIWQNTGGQDGEEPPDWLKKAIDLSTKLSQVPEEEAMPMIEEAHEVITKQLPLIGTVAGTPVVHAVKSNLGNVYDKIPWDASDWGGPLVVKPFQWYFE